MNRTAVIIGVVVVAAIALIAFLMLGGEDKAEAPTGNTSEISQPAPQEPAEQTNEVSGNAILIDEDGFSPDNLTVNVGDTVTFTNRGESDVWPASDNHPTHTVYPELDPQKAIKPGESWSFKFTKVGSWEMHDHLNSNQTAQITVNP